MKRRAAAAALTPAAAGQVSQSTQVRRIAFGGIQIECSTYGHNRTRLIDFRVRRGQTLADDPFFVPLKTYSRPFQPTVIAQAVPDRPPGGTHRGNGDLA